MPSVRREQTKKRTIPSGGSNVDRPMTGSETEGVDADSTVVTSNSVHCARMFPRETMIDRFGSHVGNPCYRRVDPKP